MTTIKAVPSATKIVLSAVASAAMFYMAAGPYIQHVLPPQFAAALGVTGVFLLAVFHDGQQIQKVANDLPSLMDHTVTIAQAASDITAATSGLLTALENGGDMEAVATASVSSAPEPAP